MALNHSVKGSVDYTVEGSPTIVDGIASGFTSSSYVRSEVQLPVTDKNYEFVIRCTPHTSDRNGAVLGVNNQFRIYFMLSKIEVGFFTNSGTSNFINISTNFTSGTYYYIKVKRQNDIASVSYSTDGVTYVSEHTITNEFKTTSGYAQYGYWGGDGWDQYNGSIDLKETYIMVNGAAWFGVCPVEVKHINYGTSVGYTKVGNPTIVNGVASGFSDSNYLQIPSLPGAQDYFDAVNPFEMVLRITTGTITRQQSVYYGDFALSITASKNLQLYYYDSTGIWATGTAILQDNTSYDIKLTYDGANIIVSYKTGNNAYTQDIVATGQITKLADYETFGNRPTFNDAYLQGTLDLNRTYIKVNDSMWFFRPCVNYLKRDDKLVFADSDLYLTGPENYTVVGTPMIVDNVASGFSDSNYLKTNGNLDLANATSVEVYMRLKTPSAFVSSGFNMAFRTTNDVESFAIYTYTENGTTYFGAFGLDLYQYTNIYTDTWYRIKVTKTGTAVTSELYDDSGTLLTSRSSTITTATNNYVAFGGYYVDTAHSWGSIDFNETYIKVNGNLWFYGKNYATSNIAPVPAGFQLNNTTTPQIGYIDMRTQVFTKAPTGAELNPVAPIVVPSRTVSGFSSLNFYDFGQFPSTITDFKFIVRGSVTSTSQRHNMLLAAGFDAGYQYSYNIRSTTGKPSLYCNQWYDGNSAVSANTNYWYYIIKSNGNYLYYTIEDNGYSIDSLPNLSNWTLQVTNTTEMANLTWRLGQNPQMTDQFWVGSMDQIRLEINNQKVFDLYDSGSKALLEASGLTVTES